MQNCKQTQCFRKSRIDRTFIGLGFESEDWGTVNIYNGEWIV